MNSSNEPPEKITAESLMKRLESDPEYVRRLKDNEEARQHAMQQFKLISLPIIEDLKLAGLSVESLDGLRRGGISYRSAVPILLKWLPLVEDVRVKESLVRALSVSWAKPIAAVPLIEEFEVQPEGMSSLKWAIGNALSIVATETVADDILALAQDKRHGKAREMVVVALGNLKNPKAVEVLINLLDDDEVCGHAIMAIAKLKAREALPKIQRFTDHPKSWIQKEAKKAISKLE